MCGRLQRSEGQVLFLQRKAVSYSKTLTFTLFFFLLSYRVTDCPGMFIYPSSLFLYYPSIRFLCRSTILF